MLNLLFRFAARIPVWYSILNKDGEKGVKYMGRYVRDVLLNKPQDFVQFIMNDYLQKNQYVLTDWKGERVYCAGDAMVEGYKYLKWSYDGSVFHLESWLKSVTGKEIGLDGFVGIVNKKPQKQSLEQLIRVLQQPVPERNPGNTGGQPFPENVASQPTPVYTVDQSNDATMALLLGIISIAAGLIIPLIGIIIACVGYSRARMGMGSRKANYAKIGQVLCIIGIVVAVINWGLGVLINILAL